METLQDSKHRRSQSGDTTFAIKTILELAPASQSRNNQLESSYKADKQYSKPKRQASASHQKIESPF